MSIERWTVGALPFVLGWCCGIFADVWWILAGHFTAGVHKGRWTL